MNRRINTEETVSKFLLDYWLWSLDYCNSELSFRIIDESTVGLLANFLKDWPYTRLRDENTFHPLK
jgi:hypothetical protein